MLAYQLMRACSHHCRLPFLPCRCLANNDAPTGAARIPLEATLPADWEGWGGSTGGKRRSGAVHRSLNLKVGR